MMTTDLLITKEGIRVAIGQVWRDLDKRMHGRRVRVVALDEAGGTVQVRAVSHNKLSMLSVRRMHKHSTGWELCQ